MSFKLVKKRITKSCNPPSKGTGAESLARAPRVPALGGRLRIDMSEPEHVLRLLTEMTAKLSKG